MKNGEVGQREVLFSSCYAGELGREGESLADGNLNLKWKTEVHFIFRRGLSGGSNEQRLKFYTSLCRV